MLVASMGSLFDFIPLKLRVYACRSRLAVSTSSSIEWTSIDRLEPSVPARSRMAILETRTLPQTDSSQFPLCPFLAMPSVPTIAPGGLARDHHLLFLRFSTLAPRLPNE